MPRSSSSRYPWLDAISYALYHHDGKLVDLFVAGRKGEDCLFDVADGRKIRNGPERSREIAGGTAGFCQSLKPQVLTAVDCSRLHFQNYGSDPLFRSFLDPEERAAAGAGAVVEGEGKG